MKNLAIPDLCFIYATMTKLEELKKRLRPGQVYRREDLARWSNAVDRHLKQLVEEGTLTKLAGGLYGYPRRETSDDLNKVPAAAER